MSGLMYPAALSLLFPHKHTYNSGCMKWEKSVKISKTGGTS